MWSCFCSEWAKLRRCQMLLVGLAAMPALALVLLALSGRWGRRTLPARAARHRRGRRR